MADRLIIDGMDERSHILDGMGGDVEDFESDSAHKEFYHHLPAAINNAETITVEQEMSAGETILIRKRGAGQFGVLRKAVSNQEDWELKVYADQDRQILLATFTG